MSEGGRFPLNPPSHKTKIPVKLLVSALSLSVLEGHWAVFGLAVGFHTTQLLLQVRAFEPTLPGISYWVRVMSGFSVQTLAYSFMVTTATCDATMKQSHTSPTSQPSHQPPCHCTAPEQDNTEDNILSMLVCMSDVYVVLYVCSHASICTKAYSSSDILFSINLPGIIKKSSYPGNVMFDSATMNFSYSHGPFPTPLHLPKQQAYTEFIF